MQRSLIAVKVKLLSKKVWKSYFYYTASHEIGNIFWYYKNKYPVHSARYEFYLKNLFELLS